MTEFKRPGAAVGADAPVAGRLSGVAVERPRDEAPRGVPVALRSVQHVVVSRGRFEMPWSKRTVMIKWVISGKAELGVGGKRMPFGPGEVAIHLPMFPHQFWAVDEANEMCWFSLDGPLAEQYVLQLDVHAGVYPYGPPPVEQIHAMMESLKDHTVQGRRAASLLVIRMLHELADRVRTPEIPSVVRQAQHIIEQEFGDPDLSTEQIAWKLGYHRGSISRLFHESTGVTIIDYLTAVRLQEAKGLLQRTDVKVADVARKCGFREQTYFCKWLRKHTGTAPRDMRNLLEV